MCEVFLCVYERGYLVFLIDFGCQDQGGKSDAF